MGNGFSFEVYDAPELRWAIDEAMRFQIRSPEERAANINRIMTEAANSYSPASMVNQYLGLYRTLMELNAPADSATI